jgi:peptide deformylase
MKLKIAQLGQPVLRQVAEAVPIEEIAGEPFRQFLQDMRDTLIEEHGAGLAAPQVFASRRVFLAAIIPPEKEGEPPGIEVFINPRIVAASQETKASWEGCLSFPELLVLVERYCAVRIEYLDVHGQAQMLELVDFPARVVQHELDHLDGVLTLDRAASTRDIIKASEIDAVS